MGAPVFHLIWVIDTYGNWKNQNPGGRFGAASLTALPIQPIWPIFAVNRLKWQCCLAGSSKMAPRILIFFNCHGCRFFILCEIHCYLCPRIFGVQWFSLSQGRWIILNTQNDFRKLVHSIEKIHTQWLLPMGIMGPNVEAMVQHPWENRFPSKKMVLVLLL